jgi:hypothetical protein
MRMAAMARSGAVAVALLALTVVALAALSPVRCDGTRAADCAEARTQESVLERAMAVKASHGHPG